MEPNLKVTTELKKESLWFTVSKGISMRKLRKEGFEFSKQ